MTDRQIDRRLAAIEAAVSRDVGRGIDPMIEAARGGLAGAALSLASTPAPRIGIITGFVIVRDGVVYAPETDGPPGAAMLAAGFAAAGWSVRVATDSPCARGMRATLDLAGAFDVPLDVAEIGAGSAASVLGLVERWRAQGLTHVVAIERCGRARDGGYYNARGVDLSQWIAPLDDLYEGGAWTRIAIGDGGNEVGMGALSVDVVAQGVNHGARIASGTGCDNLIVAGVSNWGAYALLAALAVARPDAADALLRTLTPDVDRFILEGLVAARFAVDGLTGESIAKVDTYPLEVHADVIRAVRAAGALG
jgi:hypothetical protein